MRANLRPPVYDLIDMKEGVLARLQLWVLTAIVLGQQSKVRGFNRKILGQRAVAAPANTVATQAGDPVFIGTDGIWESVNRNGRMFGKERLQNIIRRTHHLAAKDIMNTIIQTLNEYRQDVDLQDDVTLIVIKFTGSPDRL